MRNKIIIPDVGDNLEVVFTTRLPVKLFDLLTQKGTLNASERLVQILNVEFTTLEMPLCDSKWLYLLEDFLQNSSEKLFGFGPYFVFQEVRNCEILKKLFLDYFSTSDESVEREQIVLKIRKKIQEIFEKTKCNL